MSFRKANVDGARYAILVLMHWECVNDGDVEFAFGEIVSRLSNMFARNVVKIALEGLISEKSVLEPGYNTYSVSRAGLMQAEMYGEQYYLRTAKELGLIAGTETGAEAGGIQLDAVLVPASDRTVPLNHNQPECQETVSALDEVLKEFREDHRLDNEAKVTKDGILKVLEGGRRLLDGDEVSVEAGQDWIVKPLRWILDKFTQGALQAAASKALDLVLKLLGLGN